MIVHVRIPQFLARAYKKQSNTNSPVILQNESRVVSAGPDTTNFASEPEEIIESDSPPSEVEIVNPDIGRLRDVHQEFITHLQNLSPIVEVLNLGEAFVETETADEFKSWFDSFPLNFPLSAGGAPTNWLARIISYRQSEGSFQIIDESEVDSTFDSVKINELWGLGPSTPRTLRERGFQSLGELRHINDDQLKSLFGSVAGVLKMILRCEDPRPVNAFSRPRSITRSIDLRSDEIESTEDLDRIFRDITTQFGEQLTRSMSCIHRLQSTLKDESTVSKDSRQFFTPTNDQSTLHETLNELIPENFDPSNYSEMEIKADIIVADTSSFHTRTREEAHHLEILT